MEEHQVKKEQVISAKTAYLMTDLLQGVVREGTGTKAKELSGLQRGKTGTTNELKDAWFIGFTPSVLTGVWVGYDDHTVSLGKGETGGRAACPIWVYFMKEYLKDKPVETFHNSRRYHFRQDKWFFGGDCKIERGRVCLCGFFRPHSFPGVRT